MGIFHDEGFHPNDPSQFHGLEGAAQEARIPNKKYLEEIKRGLELGLEAAPSIGDRTILRSRAANCRIGRASTPFSNSLISKM